MEEVNNYEKAIALYKSSNYPLFDISDYELIGEIGRGKYGIAYLYEDKKTKEKMVIKKIFSERLNEKSIREIDIMTKMQHPCLLNLIASNLVEDEANGSEINLLLPYMPNGNIDKVVKSKNESIIQKWDTTTKMKALYGIAVGMAHMNSKKAIHRDLKPENILFDENFEIKISDFGLSRFLNENDKSLTQAVGTPFFMAPELISEETYDEKIDIYSYSIILYEILYTHQFPKTNQFSWFKNILNGKRLPIEESNFKYGSGLFKLINDCWLGPPASRPSFAEILKIFPSILPPDTDIQVFNEYAKRINPNFGKENLRPRYNTYLSSKKTSFFSETKKEDKSSNQNKQEKSLENTIEEKNEDLSQNIFENTNDDIIIDDEEEKVPHLDTNIKLNINDQMYQNDNDDEEESNDNLDPLSPKPNSYDPASDVKIDIYEMSLQKAKNGNPKELFNYAMLLYAGSDSAPKNVSKALKIIQEAADFKSVDAYYFLGTHYLEGSDGFEFDMKKARHYLSLAAESDHPLALFYMGFYDQRGLEAYPPEIDPKTVTDGEKYIWPVNKKEGFKYAMKAAEKGHAMSAIMVARSYENGIPATPGSNFTLKKDEAMATKYYRMAADSGDISSMVKFGKRAEEGIGMKKKPFVALQYIKTASREENMHAMFILGNYYFKGLCGLNKDQKTGAELIKKAADKGLLDAQCLYAKILKKGADGVPKNKEESLRYEKMGKKK